MKKIVVSLFVLVALLALIVVPTFAQDKPGTIADVVVASTNAKTPEFTTLLAAVQAADPAIMQLLSNPDANVTVFAPTDAAFAAALQSLNMTADQLLADQALLNKVLMYHIVPGRFDAASVVALNGALLGTSLPETGLAISVDGSQVKVNDATVVTPDVMAANGVIHVIDTVLLPPMDNTMATPEAMMSGSESLTRSRSSLPRDCAVWRLNPKICPWIVRSSIDFIIGSMPTSCSATPAMRRTWAACVATSKPPTVARPVVGVESVVSIETVVLLPAPLGPRKPKIPPDLTLNDTSLTA